MVALPCDNSTSARWPVTVMLAVLARSIASKVNTAACGMPSGPTVVTSPPGPKLSAKPRWLSMTPANSGTPGAAFSKIVSASVSIVKSPLERLSVPSEEKSNGSKTSARTHSAATKISKKETVWTNREWDNGTAR